MLSLYFSYDLCFSVDRWKWYKNASVDENILLRFRRDESGYFWKRITVDGPLVS